MLITIFCMANIYVKYKVNIKPMYCQLKRLFLLDNLYNSTKQVNKNKITPNFVTTVMLSWSEIIERVKLLIIILWLTSSLQHLS